MLLLVVIVTLSLAGSFLCSLCEAALYAVTPAQVETLQQSGRRGARRLAELRSRMPSAIAGMASFNTITQTFGATWTGALVGELYGSEWLGAFSAVFALAVLLLTEIIPKGIGVARASVLAPRLAGTIQAMIWTVWPLAAAARWLMHRITRSVPGHTTTEEEVLAMASLAARAGAILPDELRWVENVLLLNDITVRQLMTPRHLVFSLPGDLRLDSAELSGERLVHSRIPVTEGPQLDKVVGVVHRRTLFDHLVRGDRNKLVSDLARPALVIREDQGAHQLLNRLMNERQHLAVVTGTDGLVTGIVTLEDVIEYLLGKQIVGEHDAHPEMQRLARERARFHDRDADLNPR